MLQNYIGCSELHIVFFNDSELWSNEQYITGELFPHAIWTHRWQLLGDFAKSNEIEINIYLSHGKEQRNCVIAPS